MFPTKETIQTIRAVHDWLRAALRGGSAAIPASIPYAGAAYAFHVSARQLDQVKKDISDLRDSSAQEHQELKCTLDEIQEMLAGLKTHEYDELMSQLMSQSESNGMVLQAILSAIIKQGHPRKDSEKITAIIPCGGTGGGLFPITQVMPKCLVIIREKTLLQHILDSLDREIFQKVIITTEDYHEAIVHNVAPYGDFVECVNLGKSSVTNALIKIKGKIKTGRFLLHYNDILIETVRWQHVLDVHEVHKPHHDQIGTLLCSTFYPFNVGVITENGAGLVGQFVEKPEHLTNEKRVNLAVALFEKKVIDYCRPDDESFFAETIQRILENENICLYGIEGKWRHVQNWNVLYDLQHPVNPK
jgi:UTP-glucose-1-phosphate uridylyltransferase